MTVIDSFFNRCYYTNNLISYPQIKMPEKKLNPLVRHHQENGVTYRHMAKVTGIPYPTLREYLKYGNKEIMYMRLERIKLIKEKLGVDMLENISDYEDWRNLKNK